VSVGQPFEVDPYDLYAAGQVFAGGQQRLLDIATALLSALDGCGGMAGNDENGDKFGSRYDRAATGLLNLAAALDPSISGMATGLVTTANNFILGEHHSTAGAVGSAPTYGLPGLTVAITPASPASAIGSGSGGLADILGKFWLNGHQDKLRAAAAASGLESLGLDLQGAVTSITDNNSAASISAMHGYFAKIWTGGNGGTTPLSVAHNTCTQLASACARYADAIDQDHSDIESALWGAGLAVGVTEVVGFLGTLFTGGGSDALAAWASSAESAAILGPILATAGAVVDELLDESLSESALAVIESATTNVPVNQPTTAIVSSAQTPTVTAALDSEMTRAAAAGQTVGTTVTGPTSLTGLAQAFSANNIPKVLQHVIEPAKHGFAEIVRQAGGSSQALQLIIESLGEGTGMPASGKFQVTRTILGETVTIRGAVVKGVIRISTAFVPAKYPGN
jgi:hypothetical protein